MNRKDFLRRLGLGAATVVIAPKLISETLAEKKAAPLIVKSSEYIGVTGAVGDTGYTGPPPPQTTIHSTGVIHFRIKSKKGVGAKAKTIKLFENLELWSSQTINNGSGSGSIEAVSANGNPVKSARIRPLIITETTIVSNMPEKLSFLEEHEMHAVDKNKKIYYLGQSGSVNPIHIQSFRKNTDFNPNRFDIERRIEIKQNKHLEITIHPGQEIALSFFTEDYSLSLKEKS